MPPNDVAYHMSRMLYMTLLVSAPALLTAAVVGFAIALFQAVTQIQDQSLPQTIKIIAVTMVTILAGGAIVAPVIQYSEQIFLFFYTYVD